MYNASGVRWTFLAAQKDFKYRIVIVAPLGCRVDNLVYLINSYGVPCGREISSGAGVVVVTDISDCFDYSGEPITWVYLRYTRDRHRYFGVDAGINYYQSESLFRSLELLFRCEINEKMIGSHPIGLSEVVVWQCKNLPEFEISIRKQQCRCYS